MPQITFDSDKLKFFLDSEVKKLTGKTMKRFEISSDKEEIKKAVKEIQYEWTRDVYDFLINGRILFTIEKSKE